MQTLIDILFYLTLVSELLLLLLILISIYMPSRRFWPPPGKWSMEYNLIWSLTFISIGGIITLALLTWDTYLLSNWLLKPIGFVLIVLGNALAIWGLRELGVYASSGLEYKLVTTGPYKYTRNPQYLGDIIVLIGAILLVNSFYVLVTSILGIIIFGLLPFAEEPWLREKYGEDYIKYCNRVPRFIGRIRRTNDERLFPR